MVKTAKSIIFSTILLIAIFASVSIVFTVNPKAANSQTPNTATRSAIGKEKLTEAKLKVCQKTESSIKKRSIQMTKRSANMEKIFDSIAARVETYYTDKLLPNGKTVANYDSLVADIEANKELVEAAVTTVQTDATNFSCSGEDPKGQLGAFRYDMKTVIKALKDYRTSIKNLIVAIRSVTGETNSATNSSKVSQ